MIVVHCAPKQVARLADVFAFPVESPEGGIEWELPRWYHVLLQAACEREQAFVEAAA